MIIINGNMENCENIILDNGFNFGRGVFETILVKDKPLFLKQHCERLNRGLSVLGINTSVHENYISGIILQNNIHDCVLKIIVSEKNIVISTRQSTYKPEDYARGFKLKISKLKRNPYSHTTYIKSLNYTDNILEKELASKEGYDEVLFLNVHDELAEGCVSNIFFVKENKVFTPDISCGILDGIVRTWVMENYEVHTGRFSLHEIMKADECFITNSVMGIMKVIEIQGIKSFEDESVYKDIKNKYEHC